MNICPAWPTRLSDRSWDRETAKLKMPLPGGRGALQGSPDVPGQRPALSPSQHEPPAGVHTSTSSPAAGSATTCAEAVVAPRGAWARFPSWS